MQARDLLDNCQLCPRSCGVNRYEQPGACGGGALARVAKVSLHPWEEPAIAGPETGKGAGTIFFSGCNLRCVFCQNYEISHYAKGQEVTCEELGKIFLYQQAQGAVSLDLVTPTHYVPQIIQALAYAKERGFSLPVVYNSSGYEAVSTIELLRGTVDVYLPDLKYYAPELSSQYSKAKDYFPVAAKAIEAMVKQVGRPAFDAQGIMTRGVLVRHMVLPGARHDSMKLLDWLWQSFGDDIYLSLMSQYTPMYRAGEYKYLKRRLTTFEYDSVVDYARELGFTQCFVQQRSSATKAYVPDWQDSGL